MELKSRKEEYLTAGIRISMYCILPMIGFMAWVLCVPILFYGGMITSVDDAQGLGQTVFIFSLPMLIFFGVIPVILHLKRTSLMDLGLKFTADKKNLILFILNSSIVLVVFWQIIINAQSLEKALPVIIQLCIIGASEETLCRGIIYYEIDKGFHNKWISIILSSLIFAFLFHSGDTDLANLIIRMPLGIVLASVRCCTGNIYNSIIIHIWYNSLMFIL